MRQRYEFLVVLSLLVCWVSAINHPETRDHFGRHSQLLSNDVSSKGSFSYADGRLQIPVASPVHKSAVATRLSLLRRNLEGSVADSKTTSTRRELSRNHMLDQASLAEGTSHPAITSEGDCSHFGNLRKRLISGQPITMLVFGSSVAAGGGCTAPLPGLCTTNKCPNCCALSCTSGSHGWVRDVFDAINGTWPHPQHVLLNLGQSGSGLATVMETCLRDFITQRVDLIVLELALNSNGKKSVLSLVRTLVNDQRSRYENDPLLLFASFTPLRGMPFGAIYAPMINRLAIKMRYPAYDISPFIKILNDTTVSRVLADGWLHPISASVPELTAPMSEMLVRRIHECAKHNEESSKWQSKLKSEQWSCLRFTGEGAQFSNVESQRIKDVSKAIKIVDDKNWHKVVEVQNSHTPYKPGIQSNITNAVLRVQLAPKRSSFELRGTYLTSHQGFGEAMIDCEVCHCSPQKLSAQRFENVSVDASFATNISDAGKGCFMRIVVTKPSFKISSLAVTM